jgi:hypothetical protein
MPFVSLAMSGCALCRLQDRAGTQGCGSPVARVPLPLIRGVGVAARTHGVRLASFSTLFTGT